MGDYWSENLRLTQEENKILRERIREKDYEIERLRELYESHMTPLRREIQKCTYIVLHSNLDEDIREYSNRCMMLHHISYLLIDYPELEKQFTDVEQSAKWLRKGFYDFALSKMDEYPKLESYVKSYGPIVEEDERKRLVELRKSRV